MAKKRRKRFDSKKNAESFAKKVNGQLNDLTDVENAKSKYTVTYEGTGSDKREFVDNWNPWENRDFGYPNEFWKD